MEPIERGELIRSARKKLGWSQADLSQEMGVSRVTISNWEKGKTQDIEFGKAFRLAARLGLDIAHIYDQVPADWEQNSAASEIFDEYSAEFQGGISEMALKLAFNWGRLDPTDPVKELVVLAVNLALAPKSGDSGAGGQSNDENSAAA